MAPTPQEIPVEPTPENEQSGGLEPASTPAPSPSMIGVDTARVRAYLSALRDRAMHDDEAREVDRAKLRIDSINRQMSKGAHSGDVIRELKLIAERHQLEDRIARFQLADLSTLESRFIESALAFAHRNGIGYAAWREMGVPADVLSRAGFAVRSRSITATPPPPLALAQSSERSSTGPLSKPPTDRGTEAAEIAVKVLDDLREHGPIESSDGRSLSMLVERAGLDPNMRVSYVLNQLDRAGQIVRVVNGKRTSRIALAE
jgi:hypothetical protein